MSNSVRPQRRQPTRLPRPWDPPGKNTGVGCHFLLQCMKVKSESEVSQLCPTLSDSMDWSLPGSSVHGIFQARYILGRGLIPIFLMPNDIEYFSMHLLGIHVLFSEISPHVFCPFSNWFLKYIFSVEFQDLFVCSRHKCLVRYMV